MLEKGLRALHLNLQVTEETLCHTGQNLSIYDLKAHLRDDILPVKRALLLQQGHTRVTHLSLWGAVPIQTTTQVDLLIPVPVEWPLTAVVRGLEFVLIL